MLVLEGKKFLRVVMPTAMVLSITACQNKNSSVPVSNKASVTFTWYTFVDSS